jgi:hypothetical protein
MGGTPEGRARKRKADETRGLRERAWRDTYLGMQRTTGRVPHPHEVADKLYAENPELLSPLVRKGAAARARAR